MSRRPMARRLPPYLPPEPLTRVELLLIGLAALGALLVAYGGLLLLFG